MFGFAKVIVKAIIAVAESIITAATAAVTVVAATAAMLTLMAIPMAAAELMAMTIATTLGLQPHLHQ